MHSAVKSARSYNSKHSPGPAASSCLNCREPTELVCGKCGLGYCSKSCQVADWPSHKKVCCAKSCKSSTIPEKYSNGEFPETMISSCKQETPPGKDVNLHNSMQHPSVNGKTNTSSIFSPGLHDNVIGENSRNQNIRVKKCVRTSQSPDNMSKSLGQLEISPSLRPLTTNPNLKKSNNKTPLFTSNNCGYESHTILSKFKTGDTSPVGISGSTESNTAQGILHSLKQAKSGQYLSEDAAKSSIKRVVPAEVAVCEFPVGNHKIEIINADSPSSLTITIADYDHEIEDMKRHMDNLLVLPLEDIVPNLFCVVHVSELAITYTRAIVVRVLQEGSVSVRLIDFGRAVIVPSTNCYVMPNQLLQFPAKAIPAKLAGIRPLNETWSSESLDIFKQLLGSDGEVVFFGDACGTDANGLLSIKMYDSDDNEFSDLMVRLEAARKCKDPLTKSRQKISGLMRFASSSSLNSDLYKNYDCTKFSKFIPSSYYSVGDKVNLTLVYTTSTSFWLMTINENCSEQLSFLKVIYSPEFQVDCDASLPLSVCPSRGDIVAAFSPSSNGWYRACILDESKKKVFYLDYGNTETVDDLRHLVEEYHKPALSWCCNLCELDEETVRLLKNSENDVVTGQVISVDEEGMILSCMGKKFKLILWTAWLKSESKLNHVRNVKENNKRLALSDLKMRNELPKQCSVKLIFSRSPQQSVVHLDSEIDDLILLTRAISIHHKDACLTPYKPILNELVACQYVDKEWYRAVVLSVDNKEATVHYVDYGNSKTVPFHRIQKLNPSLLQKVFGIEVRLEGVGSALAPEYFSRVAEQFYDKQYTMEVVKAGSIPTARIYNADVNLNKEFTKFSPALRDVSAVTVYKMSDCNLRHWKKSMNMKIKFNAVFNEWLKLSGMPIEQESGFKEFMHQIQIYCKAVTQTISLYNLEVRQLCFAWNSKTNQFERACSLRVENKNNLYFVDTGYYLAVDPNRIIPFDRQFLDVPLAATLGSVLDWVKPFEPDYLETFTDHVLGVCLVEIHDIQPDKTPVFKFGGLEL